MALGGGVSIVLAGGGAKSWRALIVWRDPCGLLGVVLWFWGGGVIRSERVPTFFGGGQGPYAL